MTLSRLAFIAACASVIASAVFAADSPYAGQQSRAIKALSADEISDYLEGRGMGTSKSAELNHYPGPVHVLAQSAALGLSDTQRAQTQAIFEAMSVEAKRSGRAIVGKEAELEALYKEGKATNEQVKRVLDELARLQAEFRYSHLSAHLALRSVLTAEQVAQYDSMRGYRDDGGKASSPRSSGSVGHEHMHH
jgi:Spy/CpxP family protein refolding chaperone